MKKLIVITGVLGGAPLLPAQQLTAPPELPAPPLLPAAEQHIRSGIVLLHTLCTTLAKVQDHESAQGSVAIIVRITRELQTWAQGLAALPELTDEEKTLYETSYLPIIGQLNEHLRVQGERLAASDYFGSKDLSTALISLYVTAQQ